MTSEQNQESAPHIETTSKALTKDRSIFRVEAQQHYLANQERVVFPRFVSRKLFALLWLIALFLFLLGTMVTFWPLIEPLLRR